MSIIGPENRVYENVLGQGVTENMQKPSKSDRLLEDYKRRLINLNQILDESDDKTHTTLIRLTTKASCYRTFIAELEREIKEGETLKH